MTWLQLWLLVTVIPGLRDFSIAVIFLAVIYAAVSAILYAEHDDGEEAERLLMAAKRSCIIALFFGLVAAVIPTRGDLLIMAGGHIATNMESIKALPDNFGKAVGAWASALEDAAKSKQAEAKQ